jgi:enterochelin esterase-like enzyme
MRLASPAPLPPGLSSGLLDQLSHPTSFWTTPWPGSILAICTIASVLVLVLRHRARRARGLPPRRLRAAAAISGATVLLVLSTAAFANAQIGYLPTTDALLQATGVVPDAGHTGADVATGHGASSVATGTVTTVQIAAPARGVTGGQTSIYTPPGYDPAGKVRYPVIYLVHGWPGMSQDFFRAGGVDHLMDTLIAAHLMPPVIVVGVDANGDGSIKHDSECLNAVGGMQMEDYVTKDLVGYLDSHYRTVADRTHRVVGGMSSGGYCALNLGLKHQDLYGTVLAFEPYGDPGKETTGPLMGGSAVLFAKNSPSAYLPTMTFAYPMHFFLDVGDASPKVVARVSALSQQLTGRGQDVQFRVERGQNHNWLEVAAGLPYALAYAGTQLSAAG